MSRHTLRETTDAELAEALEQEEKGWRLVIPQLFETPGSRFDGLGADPDPEIDEELIGRVAAKVAHFRSDAAADLKHLDKGAPRHIHVEALAVVAQLDDFLVTVSDYFRSQS